MHLVVEQRHRVRPAEPPGPLLPRVIAGGCPSRSLACAADDFRSSRPARSRRLLPHLKEQRGVLIAGSGAPVRGRSQVIARLGLAPSPAMTTLAKTADAASVGRRMLNKVPEVT